jgi:hypothetical protein
VLSSRLKESVDLPSSVINARKLRPEAHLR